MGARPGRSRPKAGRAGCSVYLSSLLVFAVAWMGAPATARETLAEKTAREIREEALRTNGDANGYPLPLACSWACGDFPSPLSAEWAPANQMRLIGEGHHLLPWFAHPVGDKPFDPQELAFSYYAGPLARARELRLPIALIASQWERLLSEKPFLDLPASGNPNVVTPDGTILPRVSPFGPIRPWYDAGRRWTESPRMRALQGWYPDPPLVVFVSNNEHAKLAWTEAETDARYVDRHGLGRDADFKRQQVANGWIQRYRALQAGLLDGLESPTWRGHATCIGYDAFGPPHFARWGGVSDNGRPVGGWVDFALATPGRIDPSPLTWDGGSPSYYTHDWNSSTDHTVWSPQVEFMNLVFMRDEAFKLNPRFWFEISTWDGYHADPEREKQIPAKRNVYRRARQVYDPKRYEGFVQFGMWLLRPRAVRDFRGFTEPWPDKVDDDGTVVHEGGGPYFMAILSAVDRVYNVPTLREWWRTGRLVPNRAHPHPYQSGVPTEYKDRDRWFMLDTSLDPPRPWQGSTQLEVFSLALERGAEPEREWLIYAHAPTGDRTDVRVVIPGRPNTVTIDVTVGGVFYVVSERAGTVTPAY